MFIAIATQVLRFLSLCPLQYSADDDLGAEGSVCKHRDVKLLFPVAAGGRLLECLLLTNMNVWRKYQAGAGFHTQVFSPRSSQHFAGSEALARKELPHQNVSGPRSGFSHFLEMRWTAFIG